MADTETGARGVNINETVIFLQRKVQQGARKKNLIKFGCLWTVSFQRSDANTFRHVTKKKFLGGNVSRERKR